MAKHLHRFENTHRIWNSANKIIISSVSTLKPKICSYAPKILQNIVVQFECSLKFLYLLNAMVCKQ